jgi:hypothetical protein
VHGGLAVAIPQQVRGRQLLHALQHGSRREHVFVGQELIERDRIELARDFRADQQRFDFRRQQQSARRLRPIQRLFTRAIAGGNQRARAAVPQGEREHAAQPPEEVLAPLLVRVHEHFDV